jgi:hypothetical protein
MLCLTRDSGIVSERVQAAEAEVKNCRTEGVLPLSNYDPSFEEQLQGRLDFLPHGTASSEPRVLADPRASTIDLNSGASSSVNWWRIRRPRIRDWF